MLLDPVVEILVRDLILRTSSRISCFKALLSNLNQADQRKILVSVLQFLSRTYLNKLGRCDDPQHTAVISAASGVLHAIVEQDKSKLDHLVSWLTSSSGAGLGEGVGIRRAVLSVVSRDRDNVVNVLDKSISQFGDQLYIKHSPTLQQDGKSSLKTLIDGS
jgi:telomere length regulation protein